MPKHNPKEERDARRRRQRIVAVKKSKKKLKITHVVIMISAVWVVTIIGVFVVYLNDLNNQDVGGGGGGGGDSGGGENGEGDGNEDEYNPPTYQTDMTFTTIDGATIKLADHQGKIVILYFFDLNCPACPSQAYILADIDEDYLNSQILIIPISVEPSDSTDGLNSWKEDFNSNWNIVRDDFTYKISSSFNIQAVPTTKILDQNGNIVKTMVGSVEGSYENIKSKINELLI
jgi:peroxiredoxin